MRRFILAAVALAAVAAIFLLATLPPNPTETPLTGVDPALVRRTVAGAYHIHTTRSDGAGDKRAIAAAAARARLQFAIFTDHGDATRAPDAPEYIDGVLCIDAVEISTNGGHYVALGMPAAPYPLGGEPSAVVEDVARLGGFGVAAHPDHSKGELAWSDWNLPVDGFEWMNADAEWRNESALRLTRVLFDYLLRPAPALASVLDRPDVILGRWDGERPRPVALAAVDAHGGARSQSLEEGGSRYAIGPAYETSFRTVSNRVLLEKPLTGHAAEDAAELLAAIRRGHVYSVVDAISPSVVIDYGSGEVPRVASPLPEGAQVVEQKAGGETGWLEVHHPNAPGDPAVPWVLANVAVHREPGQLISRSLPPEGTPVALASEWRVEKHPTSSGALTVADGAITLRYELAAGQRDSQFVAAAADLAPGQPIETVSFLARAERPMRVSVQVRVRPSDARWVKSVYVDAGEREVSIPVGEMVSAERHGGGIPRPVEARSLLFVVDLTNARPGDAGAITIRDVRVSAQSPGER